MSVLEKRRPINYDINQGINEVISFKQYDADTSILDITVTDKRKPIDLTGQNIRLAFTKPDNTFAEQDSTTGVTILDGPGGHFECSLKSNTLAAVGFVETEIIFAKEGKRLSSVIFQFEVTRTLETDDAVLSVNVIPILDVKVAEAEQISQAVQVAEDVRIAAENARLETFGIVLEGAGQSEYNSIWSETRAKASEDAAKISEVNAAISETNAATSADQALSSETNAQISEFNSATSETNAELAELNARTSELAAKAAEDGALISAGNALASELAAKVAENQSKTSEQIAAQALLDLLAMIGINIATLTNGKLTPSQIPSIAINDVFPVADTAEMLLQIAQRGDVAIIMVDNVPTESYILGVDDPTDIDNWKPIGISYVANAGHAAVADVAEDSNMINGHRVVTMSTEQYTIAVKDPDTVYLVG